MSRRPSLTRRGVLARVSTSSGSAVRLSWVSRSGPKRSSRIRFICLRETSVTSNSGCSSRPTASKVTIALTISTISTGKYIRCRAPLPTDCMISSASDAWLKRERCDQWRQTSSTSRRKATGSDPGPVSAISDR